MGLNEIYLTFQFGIELNWITKKLEQLQDVVGFGGVCMDIHSMCRIQWNPWLVWSVDCWVKADSMLWLQTWKSVLMELVLAEYLSKTVDCNVCFKDYCGFGETKFFCGIISTWIQWKIIPMDLLHKDMWRSILYAILLSASKRCK